MNLPEKIISQAHKDGIKFTFDSDCEVVGCKFASEWEQTVTHPTEGKMVLNLCQSHQDDFDNDVAFEIIKKVKKSGMQQKKGEAVQK